MVVTDLNVVGITVDEPEADPPLIVDRNRILPSAIARKLMESISRRDPQIIQSRCQVYVLKLAGGTSGHIWRDPLALPVPYNSSVRLSAKVLIMPEL